MNLSNLGIAILLTVLAGLSTGIGGLIVLLFEKTNTKLYIGQGFYRYSDQGNWSNPEEVPNQLKYNSKFPFISGTIFFTYRDFVKMTIPAQVEARKILKTMWTHDVSPK